MNTDEFFKFIDGIPDEHDEKEKAKEYYKIIGSELKKLSKSNVIGRNMKSVYLVQVIIDNESDYMKYPKYSVYANGTSNEDLQTLIDAAIREFIDKGEYAFHYNYDQLEQQIPIIIQRYLNKNTNTYEYWCRFLHKCMSISGNSIYPIAVLCFDKIALETSVLYDGKKHPFLESLENEWTFGNVNDMTNKKFCYNELFRRAATRSDYFIYLYEDIFNALSALKYENESNKGSILALSGTRKQNFEELQVNYDISILFKQPIKIEEDSYKKIRKLLEIE